MRSCVDLLFLQRPYDSLCAENRVFVVLVDDIVLRVWLIVNVVVRFNDVDVGIAVLSTAQMQLVVAVEERITSVYAVSMIDKPLLSQILILHGSLLMLP